jgi:hypothetical protein
MIVTECKREALGTGGVTGSLIKLRIQEHESLEGSFRYHVVTRRNSQYWLISGTTAGVPLVESVLLTQNVKCPVAIFFRTTGNVLVMAYVSGENLETVFEARVTSLSDQLVLKIMESLASSNGVVISVDEAIDRNHLSYKVFKAISSTDLNLKNLTLKSGDNHKSPVTTEQKIIFALFAIFVISVAFFLVKDEQKKIEKTEEINLYSEFRQGLESRGAVKGFTWQLYRDLAFIRNIDGWNVSSMNIENETALIELDKTETGRIDDLLILSNRTGRSVIKYGTDKATVLSVYKPVPALGEAIIAPIEGVRLFVELAQDDWFDAPMTSISYGVLTKKNGYSVLDFDWKFDQYYEDDFDLVGTVLNMLPITFNKASFTFGENGSVNGLMQFSLYGCEQSNISSDGKSCL